ncbi:hypothetical protein EPUS_08594 [Endocarpon pusillum Z07020]|uniref:DNA2/NAM7 helicase helicase domain-containing protein n=1 Tax=Endocarpon pusillum (strain Z07020 / HMAS-L-300199) TaxID=1263415 RepID=U1G005_ENDPU|nr:uncharacterized protein EPUS_08594 [Endocarpon pusillum Z07020]ERF70532.1 hypothetical protein EPUS_08594 [Endocarpon pusillum Z07020]
MEPLPDREPTPEVEMTEPEQPVDAPVGLATLRQPMKNKKNVDIGTLRQNGDSPDSWRFTFILNFGRYGKPAFMLRCRRNKVATQKLDESKSDSYLEVTFEWQPGVSFLNKNGEKLYQLDNLARNVLSKENVPLLAKLGWYYPRAGSEIEKLSDSDKAGCVNINFQSRTPRIETDVIKTQAIANTTEAEKEFIGDLYSEDVVDMSVTFLLPLGSQYSDRGIDGSRERSLYFLNIEYPNFQDAFENRLATFISILRLFHPGEKVEHKREALEAELQETGAIARWPPGDAFYHYRKQIFFTSTGEFLTHVLGSVVRDQQWVEGEYMAYSAQDINFAVVRSYQAQVPGDVQLTEEDKARRQGFFLYGYLPKDKKLHLPALDSQWNIEFKKTVVGKQIHQERHLRWTGYVKPITDDERQVTGAQFVMVATRPLGGQRIRWAPSIHELAPGNYHPGRMTQIIDRVGQDRILKACKEFCDPLRTDLENFRIPLIFTKEIKAFHHVNLIAGGDPKNDDQNRTFFDWVFNPIQGRLNKDQKQIFERDLRQVWNGTKFVKGGPGCIKTSTMAWVVLLLSLIDHKVMIVAEDNGSVNQFMKTLESVRVELGSAAIQSKSQESKALIDQLSGHIHFRFEPPVQEKDALLDNDFGKGNMHRTGRPDDPDAWKNTADAMSLVMASLAHREALAQMNAEIAKRAELEGELSRHQGDLKRLQSEYARRAVRSDKLNKFPARQFIVYLIEVLRDAKRQDQLAPSDERFSLIDTYDKAQEALLRGQGNPRKLASALSIATDALYAWVARSSHVLGTTHGSCVNVLVKGNFRPTVVVHEEGSRVKVPTALCAMSFENVKAHIFMGDLHQLPPFQSSKTMNEFSEMGELSILQLYEDK